MAARRSSGVWARPVAPSAVPDEPPPVPDAPPDFEPVCDAPLASVPAAPPDPFEPEPLLLDVLDPESEAEGLTEVPEPLVAVPPMRPPEELEPGEGNEGDDAPPPDEEPDGDEEPPEGRPALVDPPEDPADPPEGEGIPALGEEEPPLGIEDPEVPPPVLEDDVEPPLLELGAPAVDPDEPLGEPGEPALPESLPQPATASVAATTIATSVGRKPRISRLFVIASYLTLKSRPSTWPGPRLLR